MQKIHSSDFAGEIADVTFMVIVLFQSFASTSGMLLVAKMEGEKPSSFSIGRFR